MHLSRLDLVDFRAFSRAKFTLGRHGLVLIVGANNSGKSALLTAIDVLLLDGEITADWTHANTTSADVIAEFALDDKIRSDIFAEAGQSAKLRERWLRTSELTGLRVVYRQQPSVTKKFVVVRVEIGDGEVFRPIAEAKHGGPGTTFDFHLAPFGQWITNGAPNATLALSNAGSSSDPRLLDQLRLGGRRSLGDLALEGWRRSVLRFETRRGTVQRAHPLRSDDQLKSDGSNLAQALVWLQTNKEEEWLDLRNLMEELIPEVGRLRVSTEHEQAEITFDDGTVRRNLKDLGSGVEQLLMTVYAGVRRLPASVVITEEPEGNLHPDAQRRLLSHLTRWAGDRQLIVATHSPIFLDAAKRRRASTWLVEREHGVSSLTSSDSFGGAALSALGVRMSDVLGADALLLLEGESDVDVIEAWFGQDLEAANVAVVAAGGGDRAWDAERFSAWMDAAVTLPIPVLFLRDRDELNVADVQRLERGPVHVLAQRELENYMLNPAAIAAYVRSRRSESASSDHVNCDDGEISRLVQKAADEMFPTVALKRFVSAYSRERRISRSDVEAILKRGGAGDIDALQKAVTALIASRNSMTDDLDRLWSVVVDELRSEWPSESLRLAPGTEILERVLAHFDLRLNKTSDCGDLAKLIGPPEELRGALRPLIDRNHRPLS